MKHKWVKAPKDWVCTSVSHDSELKFPPRAVVGCKLSHRGMPCGEGRCSRHRPRIAHDTGGPR